MISRRTETGWEDTSIQTYKEDPGQWMKTTRQNLFPDSNTSFEVRYFEIAPGGSTSYERHQHEHCVVVINGNGEVFLSGIWELIQTGDTVHIPSLAPHQFRNRSNEPFGILCIVDRERDRPELLGENLTP